MHEAKAPVYSFNNMILAQPPRSPYRPESIRRAAKRMTKKRRTSPEKAAIVANIIAIAIVVALAIPSIYQAWVNAWIVKETTASVLRQDRQHLQEEQRAAQDATPAENLT